MNDPGLDGPIQDADNEVNDYRNKAEDDSPDDDTEEEEQSYLIPARWWYASTACPLAAGTFGPMASAFSICALGQNWRVTIPPNGTEEHGIDIPDPQWLIAVNGVSLACALIANLSLLLNMARRIPFAVAQPITILGFWLASVLLIALVAVANSSYFEPPGNEDHALTGAYYYAIFAAGIYQIVSYLMCVTVYGAYTDHYSKEFKLTVAQRTLMLQTISFLVWQHCWALAYSHIEGWEYLDAVYWADFTSLTVGIGGTYVPTTHLGRSLLFVFALGGIVILGLLVGSIRSLALDRGKLKLEARMTEKARQRLIKRIAAAMEKRDQRHIGRVFAVHKVDQTVKRALTLKPGDTSMSERDRRYYEFEAMRKVQAVASTRRRYFSLFISATAFAFLWLMGAYVFYKAEHNQDWSYFVCLYFAYTTLLTIGYGDFEPMSNSGKAFFVFWSLLAIPTLTILISNMGDTVVQWVKDATIWLGEVTVLPSNEATMTERLRYGIHRTLFGQDTAQKKHQERRSARQVNEDDTEKYPYLDQPPGKVLGRGGFRKRHGKVKDANQRIAADFEKLEAADERAARARGNKPAEDEHHLRRVLLEEIRSVYADASAAEPKRYSYADWVYYIKLLGQDEADSRYHLQPHETDDAPGSHTGHSKNHHNRESEPANTDLPQDADRSKTPWSWIGQKSPLMDPKSEPEWLLEKLFQRLEASLQKQVDETTNQSAPPARGGTQQRRRMQDTSTSPRPSASPNATSRSGADSTSVRWKDSGG